MPSMNVTVAIPDLDKFDDVVRAAETHGLDVKARFRTLGVATGAVEESKIEALRSLPGVGSVEAERIVRPA